jgi:serine/threonine protein phosphatase PrpC
VLKTFAVNWHYGVATHSGWFRMVNEDKSLLRIGTTDSGEPYAVAVIADGMGGSGDGSLASDIALDAVKQWLDEQVPPLLKTKNVWTSLSVSAERLFHHVNNLLIKHGEYAGLQIGTTLSLIFLLNEMYFICHIGDCRIYKVNRKHHLKQLSLDQSWASEQIRKGRLSKLQILRHPKRSVLLQSLGMHKQIEVMKRFGFYNEHSLFMLCSDGFYNRLPDHGMERFFRASGEPEDLQQLCDTLVDKALENRSKDNVSVILLRAVTSTYAFWGRIFHRAKNFNLLFPTDRRK